jgi:hypothetical protein
MTRNAKRHNERYRPHVIEHRHCGKDILPKQLFFVAHRLFDWTLPFIRSDLRYILVSD